MFERAKNLDVCFSYAGEDREFVEAVATPLKKMGVENFCYTMEGADWGENLETFLADIYTNRSKFCVVFFSKHYVGKPWPKFELKRVTERQRKEKRAYILPVRLDDTEIPPEHQARVYLDARGLKEPEEVAYKIVRKLIELWRRNERISPWLIAAASIVLVALLTGICLSIAPSNTRVVAIPRGDAVIIEAENKGWKSSMLKEFVLRFPAGLDIKPVPLKIVEGSRIIPAGDRGRVVLKPAKKLERPCVKGERFTRSDIREGILRGKMVTVDVVVRESNEKERPEHPEIRADLIQNLIEEGTPEHSAPCDEDPFLSGAQ